MHNKKRNVKRKYFFLMFLILIVLITGCQTDKNPTTDGPFTGGTSGVELSFVNLAPPSEFSQTDQVKVKVLLKNKGETRIGVGNAKARLFGVNLESFGLPNVYKSNLGNIEAAGEFTAEGGEQEIDFGKINYKLQIINQETFSLSARLCYPYQTIMKTDACIQSSTTQQTQGEVCSLAGEKIGKGGVSSAPVQITSLTEQYRGIDQVRFDIKIENKGKGQVYSIDAKCEDLDKDELRFENKNKVKVKIKNPVNVKCGFRSGEQSNEGTITLDETGLAILSCWKDVEEPVVEKLDVQLDYLYREQVTKQIKILQSRR